MNLLLVDDDKKVYDLLNAYMNKEDHLFFVQKLDDVLNIVRENNVHMLLLDINLENENGLDFLSKHKAELERAKVPVILLSQVKELKAKLEAFQFGAQDYIVKPFEPLELLARVKIRLDSLRTPEETVLKKGDLTMNFSSQTVKIETEDQSVSLSFSAIEFRLLSVLARNEDKIFSREELLQKVWSEDLHIIDRVVDQHVSKIRKKIKPSQYTIVTHFGRGYSFGRIS